MRECLADGGGTSKVAKDQNKEIEDQEDQKDKIAVLRGKRVRARPVPYISFRLLIFGLSSVEGLLSAAPGFEPPAI